MINSDSIRLVACLCAAVLLTAPLAAQEKYPLGTDSQRQAEVPQGKVTKHSWTSQIFPGTLRDYWIYVPAQYKAGTPAAVMVFQDGAGYVNEEGRYRTPIVFDNLIHKGEMPVTIGIFISPGVVPGPEGRPARTNRSFEYDALGDRYARFLLDEILPEIGKQYTLTSDPNLRAISGQSSGGICAFTVAWNRPDAFRRVLSFIGSYTNLRGGEIYSSLIRKTEPKPLRVFLQDGSNDLNNFAGNWWIANQDMASALEFAGYDFQFAKGDEAHNNIHGSSILPDALRWLWRGHGTPIAKPAGREGHWASSFTEPQEDWELVSEGYRFTEGPAIDKAGNVFFTDIPNNRIHKIAPDGKVSVFKEDSGAANGLMFGADGRLYACQNGRKRIVAYTPDGAETVIAEDVNSNDLVVTHKGDIYFTDPGNQQVWHIGAGGNKSVAHKGIERPNGIILSPDQNMLMVNDSRGKWVWSFQIQADGSLGHGQPFYRLETPDESSVSGADGMAMASDGHLLVTSRAGLQICDLQGRVAAILNKPHSGPLANAVFAGPDLQTLYVTAGDKVLRRKMRLKGVLPWEVVKPVAARP